jgi:polysaccharide deacetylase family protein (PEP-CTERM system associated)
MSPALCARSTQDSTISEPPLTPTSLNCMTVDIEEYFQAEAFHSCLNPDKWPQMQRRAEPFVERIVGLIEEHGSRATFFVLGDCVEPMGMLLRSLVQRGHEIACHGYDHRHLARLTPAKLHDDLRRARHRIEDTVGCSPRGYRAPTFSVTRATAWALDVIIAEGFEYDASIFPIRHDRYGVPGAPRGPFWAVAPSGVRILEFPPLTLDWGLLRVPVGGGGYLRLLPEAVVRRSLATCERRGQAALLYVHPWELDPHQPHLPLGPIAQWRHRVNLHKTESKLGRVLQAHRFDTARSILEHLRANCELPTFHLVDGRFAVAGSP